MKTTISILKTISLLGIICLFSSLNTLPSTKKKVSSRISCTEDIWAQNSTSKIVDFVKFTSDIETKTLTNLSANGGGGSGILTYNDVSISVKLSAYPGTGRIRIMKGGTQVYCTNFSNSSTSVTYTTPEDFSGCGSAFYVYIETTSC